LASICARARSLAVAGTHGKTTTTSMLMLILAEAGWRPSFVIGGDVQDMGTGAHWSGSEWFVVEADESDGTHLELPLYGTILTNVETDHLDHFGSLAAIEASFDQYLAQVAGPKVVCGDDPIAARLAGPYDTVTYGVSDGVAVRAVDVRPERGAFRFEVEREGRRLVSVNLPLRGVHNVVNATGAIAMALALGIDPQVASDALAKFGGVARRFDIRGDEGGATFVDDYAHLPSEIDAVLRAARGSGDAWQRVIAVFQPNRYNRMSEMWRDYADAFAFSDVVVLTEIYAANERPIAGVSGRLLVESTLDAFPWKRVAWLPRKADVLRWAAAELRPGDLCLTAGAGDVTAWGEEILAAVGGDP
jgi:UDP-N-acetylmuramate--alanine ligase